jgi:hypothetical protein
MRLLKYLTLGATRDGSTVSAYRRPLGYFQLTLTSSALKLTLPTPIANSGLYPGYAIIQCAGAAATDFGLWRDDGTAPVLSGNVGMRLFSGQELDYSGDLTMIQWIIGAGSPVLNVSFYA